jgi:hypothetical protein
MNANRNKWAVEAAKAAMRIAGNPMFMAHLAPPRMDERVGQARTFCGSAERRDFFV